MSVKSLPGKRVVSLSTLNKKPYKRIMRVISDNWDILGGKEKDHKRYICYSGHTLNDAMMDAFEQVIRDESIKDAGISEILERFKYRVKLCEFKIIKNHRTEQMILYGGKTDDTGLTQQENSTEQPYD